MGGISLKIMIPEPAEGSLNLLLIKGGQEGDGLN